MKNFVVLSLIFAGFILSSCGKNKVGAWEHHRENDGIYVCYPEDSDYLSETDYRIYWASKSCNDLGYSERGSSIADHHFVNENGESTPGRNGAFWDDYNSNSGSSSGGGGSSAACDLANYNGPEFNIQVDSQCKTAYIYDCQQLYQERDVACDLYYSWESSWTGSGSFPSCPYCP